MESALNEVVRFPERSNTVVSGEVNESGHVVFDYQGSASDGYEHAAYFVTDTLVTDVELSATFDIEVATGTCDVRFINRVGFATSTQLAGNAGASPNEYTSSAENEDFSLTIGTSDRYAAILGITKGSSQANDCVLTVKSLKYDGVEQLDLADENNGTTNYYIMSTSTQESMLALLHTNATLQFIILVSILTIALCFAISALYKKRTYLQYGGGDVEMREDL